MAVECVIVGGGAAGLSAGLVLGRARRRILLVDSGNQSNRAAHGIGGLLGYDGRPPAELYAAGRAELAAYPSVEVRDGTVVDAVRSGDGFVVATTMHQRSELAQRLGVQFAEPGPVVVDAIVVDPFCRTSVPGVFAAGDVSAQMPQVSAAVAAGSLAGAAVMQTLMSDEVGLPIPGGNHAGKH